MLGIYGDRFEFCGEYENLAQLVALRSVDIDGDDQL